MTVFLGFFAICILMSSGIIIHRYAVDDKGDDLVVGVVLAGLGMIFLVFMGVASYDSGFGLPMSNDALFNYKNNIWTVVHQQLVNNDHVAIIKSVEGNLFFIKPETELPQDFAVVTYQGSTKILSYKDGKVEITLPTPKDPASPAPK